MILRLGLLDILSQQVCWNSVVWCPSPPSAARSVLSCQLWCGGGTETELRSCRYQQHRSGSGRLNAFMWHPDLGSVETVEKVAGLQRGKVQSQHAASIAEQHAYHFCLLLLRTFISCSNMNLRYICMITSPVTVYLKYKVFSRLLNYCADGAARTSNESIWHWS